MLSKCLSMALATLGTVTMSNCLTGCNIVVHDTVEGDSVIQVNTNSYTRQQRLKALVRV